MNQGGIRARVALAAAFATAVVIILGGGLVTLLVGNTEHRSLDKRLAEQASAVQSPIISEIESASDTISVDVASRRPDVGTVIRIYRGGVLIGAVGSTDITFPSPTQGGFDTVPAGGGSWRVLNRFIPANAAVVEATGSNQPVVLETAVPTSATDELVDTLRRRVLEIAALSAVIAGALGWYFGSVAIRPLARLRATAEQVANSRDLGVRVPGQLGPREVNDLAASFNVMLERLQEAAASTDAALASSRAFAGNAAHEMRTPLTSMQANLDVLVGNPDLPVEQTKDIIHSLVQEQSRLISLLDALHVLARGDVVGETQREPMDLSDLVGVAVASVQKRFPDVEFRYAMPSAATDMFGWQDGLRLLVENLLTNAARHGGRRVEIGIETRDGDWWLTVDDDGPGIKAEDRRRVFERFVRGVNVQVPGTGLGLALVAQQARIHGGDVEIVDSALGGARFIVRLQAAPTPQVGIRS